MTDHMQAFIAVVQHQSLNKASRQLNISQPALSRKMMTLEDELGVKLFERKGKRLLLTQAGRDYYEHALEVKQLQRKFAAVLSRHKEPGKLAVTFGASLTTLQSTLPDLIGLFTREFPESDIKVLTGKTHEIIGLLKDNRIEIGLVASKVEQPDIRCIPLFDDHLCLVAPTGHPLLEQTNPDIRRLHELPMILFSKGTWYRILMDELFHRYAVFPDIKMEIDSFEAILRLISTCGAAALLPKSYLRPQLLEDNELVLTQLKELTQTVRTTSLICRADSALPHGLDAWMEKARALYRST